MSKKTILFLFFIMFFFLVANSLAVEKATEPIPADGATGVSEDYAIYLRWTAGDSAESHDVYLGTDETAVTNATTASDEFMDNKSRPSYAFMDFNDNTMYYWRIDEVTAATTVKGDVWSFKTYNNGPIAWYKFDETSGIAVTDSSDNGFDTVIIGDTTPYWNLDGALGGCLEGDGQWTGMCIDVPSGIFSTISTQATIAWWIELTANTVGGAFFTGSNGVENVLKSGPYPHKDTEEVIDDWYQTWSVGSDATNWWWGYGDEAIYEWHHMAIVYDEAAGSKKLYFNGEVKGTAAIVAGDSIANVDAFRLFSRSTTANAAWDVYKGKMDDIRIYDKALNANEIITLVNPVDLNGDKSVDLRDLAIMVDDWLDSTGSVQSDLNSDNVVNFEDYAIWADNLFEGGNYYFDSVGGDDGNLGTSPEEAWQSLSKFNSTTFLPGEKIYFKAGSQWNGGLTVHGSGTDAEPIIIDAYGDISNENNKPRFDGNGTVSAAISVTNVEYWEFNNLQATNLGVELGNWRKAVGISSSGFGQMNHIHFKNMYVHSVNGEDVFGGGAAFSMGASDPTGQPRVSFVNDLLIENCHIKSIDNCGIHGGGGSATPGEAQGTNHIIRGNYFEDMGGAAVIVIGADGCIVENNVVNGCMKRYGSCAMWPWGAFNTIFQYNEVYGCDDRGDGESFDSDYHSTGSIFQYNYSHDNPGGFMRICNDNEDPVGNVGTIVRYNISINDGSSTDAIFPTWKRCDDVQIYNNIIYSPTGTVPLVDTSASGGDGAVWNWSNNIFYSNGTLRYDISDGSTNYWSNNCFYGTHQIPYLGFLWQNGTPSDAYKITSNPNFVSPTLSAPMGIDSLDGFKLQSGSPCIGAGTTITGNGGYDFWGNVLYNGVPDIGAHEKP